MRLSYENKPFTYLLTYLLIKLKTIHIGEGSGSGSGQTFCQQSRVGSGQRFDGSGRVREKWPVDNSDTYPRCDSTVGVDLICTSIYIVIL